MKRITKANRKEYTAAKHDYHVAGERLKNAQSGSKPLLRKAYLAAKNRYHTIGKKVGMKFYGEP